MRKFYQIYQDGFYWNEYVNDVVKILSAIQKELFGIIIMLENDNHQYIIRFNCEGIKGTEEVKVGYNFLQVSSTNEESIRAVMKISKWYIVFSAVIFAPIVEELVFRKSVRSLIKNKWLFILTSGLLFGLIHCVGSATLIEYLYVIPYAIPGCVFAYILYDSDNIFTTMSMHLWHNTIMLILEFIVMGLGIL